MRWTQTDYLLAVALATLLAILVSFLGDTLAEAVILAAVGAFIGYEVVDLRVAARHRRMCEVHARSGECDCHEG